MGKFGATSFLLCGCFLACTSSFTFTPNEGRSSLPAATLYLTGFPESVVAGQQGNLTLTAYDDLAHIATSYAATVHFVSSDANAILPSDYTFTADDLGAHTFRGVSLRTADPNAFIHLVDGNGMIATLRAIAVTPGAASQLAVTGASADTVIAGQALTVSVTARDAYGNTDANYAGTVHFGSSDTTAIPPFDYTFVSSDAGVHVYTDGILLFTSGLQSVTASDGAGLTGTWAVHVASSNARALALSLPAVSVAGAPVAASLVAYDAFANRAAGYRGTVQFTSSDLAATLPSSYTFTAADAGSHAFAAEATVLRTAGVISVTAADANIIAPPSSAQTMVAVNANVVHGYIVQIPATVHPSLDFSGQVRAVDVYNNTVETYAGTAVLLSSDPAGSPSNTVAKNILFQASNLGVVTVPGLFLPTVGNQTLTAHDSALHGVQGTATAQVQAQNFTLTYYFDGNTAANYAYDASRITIAQSGAALSPIDTLAGDAHAADFAAGTQTNLAWDANNYLRLGQGAPNSPVIFYSGLEQGDPGVTWSDTVDTGARGISNVGGLCCGLTGPEANPNSTRAYANSTYALLYSGAATGNAPNYAYTKVWNLAASDIALDANSYVAYWIFPQAQTGATGNSSVAGSNSLYTALNVVFTDATDTVGAALVDGNNIAFTPQAQGAGGRLALGQWNYVRVSLAALAGKHIDHISVGWQNSGATGGYRGFIDQVYISGVSAGSPLTNAASLSANWTPQWNHMSAYWPFDGAGSLLDGGTIPAAIGPNLTIHNSNGAGMGYVQGKVNQAIYMDGVDDWLVIPGSISGSGPWSVSAWLELEFWQSNSAGFAIGSDRYNSFFWQPTLVRGTLWQSSGTSVGIQRSVCCSTNAWEHVLVTSDNANLTLYIDGVAVATTSNPPVPTLSGGFIGQSGWGDLPFPGKIDEVALWGATLNANEVRAIYERQRLAFAGSQLSRVVASPFLAPATSGLLWAPSLPFDKPLASNDASEIQSAYPALTNSALNANLVALWHFDEPALGTVLGGDFNDDSGHGDVASVVPLGGGVLPGQPGVLGRSIRLPNSAAHVIATGTTFASPNVFTLQAWFRYAYNSDSGNGGKLIGFGDSASGYSGYYDRHVYLDAANHVVFGVYNGALVTAQSPQSYGDNRWHQAVASLSSAGLKLYVDGALVSVNNAATSGQSYTGFWHIGGDKLANWPGGSSRWTFTDGFIDEAAVWLRALSDNEVLQLYRRGANRLTYQLRFCTAANCSDGPAWVGPDATSASYFSELDNVSGGAVLAGAPRLTFAPAVAALTSAPYVQYQAFFQSDDTIGNCSYAGQQAPCSPEVSAVDSFRSNYDTSGPGIKSLASAATPYYSLASFAADTGTAGCVSGVRYSLSFDGVHNYYYTGANWATSDGSVGKTNLAGDLTNAVMAGFAQAFPLGATYFTAYLHSDGISPCALNDVSISGTQ